MQVQNITNKQRGWEGTDSSLLLPVQELRGIKWSWQEPDAKRKKKEKGIVPHTAGIESAEVLAEDSACLRDWHGFTVRLWKVLDRGVTWRLLHEQTTTCPGLICRQLQAESRGASITRAYLLLLFPRRLLVSRVGEGVLGWMDLWSESLSSFLFSYILCLVLDKQFVSIESKRNCKHPNFL